MILESIAPEDTRFWHFHFGQAGTCNDINVVDASHLMDSLILGLGPQVVYEINGNVHTTPYYLVDGIYPRWKIFEQAFSSPVTPAEKKFTTFQEVHRTLEALEEIEVD